MPDILNDCVCCAIDNQISEDGVRDIAEALKVNSTLADINLIGGNVFVCFFIRRSSIHEQATK